MVTDPRLLVTVRLNDPQEKALGRLLEGVPWVHPPRDAPGPWPTVEAVLTGVPSRELPALRPELLPRVRFVQRVFTGLDGFPFALFPPETRFAGNVGAYAVPVSELALTLVLALAKSLVPDHQSALAGERGPLDRRRISLKGRRALILGYGAIGRELAPKFRALGMSVDGLSRSGEKDAALDRLYRPSERLEALRGADVVVNVLPLTRETRGFVGAPELEAMGPRAILVNVGRAATVDPEALVAHLRKNPGFHVGEEVWWDEPGGFGRFTPTASLADFPGSLGTPHVGGFVEDAYDHALASACTNLARFFRGEVPLHLVDPREYASA